MKFKRNTAVILTCYYLVISLGFTLTIHFCGGSLAGVSAVAEKGTCEVVVEEACCTEEPQLEEGCCSDSVLDFSDVDSDVVFLSNSLKLLAIASPTTYHVVLFASVNKTKLALPNYTYQSNAPPLYKLHQSYIYYG